MTDAAPAIDDPRQPWRVLAAVIVGLFMVILDGTAVNVALKTLQVAFNVETHAAQSVISLYVLALGVTTPLAGFLADRFGIKRIYLLGLGIFGLGSLFCGLAPTFPLLVAARTLQGVGGGLALPLGSAQLFQAFPPDRRGAAFGIFGLALVVAPATGPLLAGTLIDHGHLPWVFFLNLPIAAAGVLYGARVLKEKRKDGPTVLDLGGMVLAVLGFGALLFAASLAGEGEGWTAPPVLGGLAVGITSLVLLVLVELRAIDPLLDVRLFRRRTFFVANIAGLVGTVALFGAEFLLPLYLQIVRGESATTAGLSLLPLALASGFASPLGGRLADRIGPRIPVVTGFVLIAFNSWQLSHLTMTTSLRWIGFLLALRGIAGGLIIQNTQVAALGDVPPQELPRATSLVAALRTTVQAIAVAALASVVATAVTTASLHDVALRQAQYLGGLTQTYRITFVVSVLAAAMALLLPNVPRARAAGTPKAAAAAA
jgi:DHA2 family multidrug resistance protein